MGTDEFTRTIVRDTLEGYAQRVAALQGMDPQVGFGLLRMCVSSAPIFLAQVTPPLLVGDLFEDFDRRIQESALQLLLLQGHEELACSEERTARALERLSLPIRLRGAGITSISLRHPIAYFASVAVCAAADSGLAEHIGGLERFASDTHARLLQAVGPASRHTEGIEDLIVRAKPDVLLDPAYFVDLLLKRDDKNIQKPLTRIALTARAQRLHNQLFTRGGGTCADMDLVAACSADRSARIFTARLSDPHNRLQPFEFVAWARRFLQLPALARLGNAAPRARFDYAMEQCLGDHAKDGDAWLDLYGSHDNGQCAPTARGKHLGHNLLKYVLHRFARMVPGIQSTVEPKTSDVLHGQLSDAQCQKLFPKAPSAERLRKIKDIVNELDTATAMPAGSARSEALRAVEHNMDALNTANSEEKKKAVRLDLRLQHGPDELLVDATIVHSLSKTHRQAEAGRTMSRLLSEVKAVKERPAAAIETAERRKASTYAPLLYIIKKQVADGRRSREPVYATAAVTTFGELGADCAKVQEWIAMRYKAHLLGLGHRADGLDAKFLVGKFRADLRLALMMVTVRRMAAMQEAAGLPADCVRGLGDRLSADP